MTDVTSPDDLAPDEKRCPYCAETIKAAAVKCRFCQSDLAEPPTADPLTAGADAAEPTGSSAPPIAPVIAPAGEPRLAFLRPTEPGATRASTRVVAVLVVLCLVLGGALWFLVDRSRHPHLDTAPNGQVTQSSFRNAAMSAASDAAGKILSYSWKTFDADRKAGRALVTGEAAKEYDQAMDEVAAKVADTKLTLKATVLSVGTISVEEHRAKVLVFVDTATTREGSKDQQLQQSRLVMDLIRKDGDWTVSKMDAF
jgi:Mce-associated membrane protein